MAEGNVLLTMTFAAAASSGIVARRVVVEDPSTHGNVKLPAAAAEPTVVGVTTEKVSAANNVAVAVVGFAVVESDGTAVINPGDYLICGTGADGRVKSIGQAGRSISGDIVGMCVDSVQIPATAGAYVTVFLLKRSGKAGTALVAGDFALTNWGAGATFAIATGSTDTRGSITITTAVGDASTANPSVALTFHDGTFPAAPFANANMDSTSTGPLAALATHCSATVLTLTYIGTPTTTSVHTYILTWGVQG